MEFTFDLAGARRAAEEGRLLEWTIGKVTREGSANRPLAAILRGQRPLLSGPVRVPLAGLERIAGGEPGFKYSVPMAQWEREIAPLLAAEMEACPPILLRYGTHVSDGNHRVDAWLRQGHAEGWAIVWEDSDPRFKDWWTPFPPEESPTFEARGELFVALSQGRVVGSFRLAGGELTELWVDPAWRGLRLGSRMLRVARPLMDGQAIRAAAPPCLVRFFGRRAFGPSGRRRKGGSNFGGRPSGCTQTGPVGIGRPRADAPKTFGRLAPSIPRLPTRSGWDPEETQRTRRTLRRTTVRRRSRQLCPTPLSW